MQERSPEFSLARTMVPESGTEKLADAATMRRGMAVPSVTSSMFLSATEDTKSVVVQASDLAPVQSRPEKPLVQIHEHTPWLTTLVPPFWHTRDDSHFPWLWSAVLWLPRVLNTKNCKGMTMATAIAAKMSMRTRIKAHRGRPQQRRAGFLSSALDSALSKSAGCVGCDASWGTSCRPGARGHDVVLNQELRRARGSRVACAGGGNAANMSENPDRRWSDTKQVISKKYMACHAETKMEI
jgi:hypothetical protein